MTTDHFFRVAVGAAATPSLWRPMLHHDPVSRWHVRLHRDDTVPFRVHLCR